MKCTETVLQELREVEFSAVTKQCIYLNHAASSPLPLRSANTLRQCADLRQNRHRAYIEGTYEVDLVPLQVKLSTMLQCDVDEIGFVPSATDGIATIANGIDWKPGDNVIVPECDFPGLIYPWLNLAHRGVQVRFCSAPAGIFDVEALISEITPATRVIAVSHVQWASGHKIDLSVLGRVCRERGILTVVDAAQSLGTQSLDVKSARIDVLVSCAFKFLLGIPGVAVLYVDREALPSIHPDHVGFLSVQRPLDLQFTWLPGTQRFLAGSVDETALSVLDSSLNLLFEVGIDAIQQHTAGLLARLDTGLKTLGVICRSSPLTQHRSSILAFTTGAVQRDEMLLAYLLNRNIIVSLRSCGIRVAPHCYNSDAEMELLLEAVRNGIAA